jgi:hypothetical protein
MADAPTDHTLALLRRLDAKLDRLQAMVDDHTGRLQRLEQRYGRADRSARDDGERSCLDPSRFLMRLDGIERRLRKLEDGTL